MKLSSEEAQKLKKLMKKLGYNVYQLLSNIIEN